MRETPPPPPSWDALAPILAALAAKGDPTPAPAREEAGLPKWLHALIVPLAVLFLGALGNYAGSSIAGVGQIAPKIEELKTAVNDLKQTVDQVTAQSQAQQVTLGRQDLRLATLEQGQARILERIRQLEGREPIGVSPTPPPPGAP